MKLTKKITLLIAIVLAALCFAAGLITLRINAEAYTDRIEITSNAGDTFKKSGNSFEKQNTFVFAATVNFNNGDAAALTFGETESGLWAFNIDRASNRVKLLYFDKSQNGYSARELLSEYFIGNDKLTDAEREMIAPNVRRLSKVRLKIVVKPGKSGCFLECYADGIRRFAYTDGSEEASALNLNADFAGLEYSGGDTGFNVCNADVYFDETETGPQDNSYYTELYRNRFHYSQFAHWNNDPNGLVYYKGYYHLYYQHNPFDSVWGAMYWGHARSKDLIHWENLPICLFPERAGITGSHGAGDGYMWSGSARVYRKGDSSVIDGSNWFANTSSAGTGESVGLIGFYTRDGAKQDQMIMSSSDGGLTWTKRNYIPSQQILGLGEAKTDCRDPKVFKFGSGSSAIYGMLLTGMNSDNVWFLKSADLINWSAAGGFKARVPLVNTSATNGPECPDIAFLTADNGEEKAVITLTGRGYLVGDLTFESGKFVFRCDGKDLSSTTVDQTYVKQMDFGPDSYATQTFYIDEGEHAGKTVSVSWFSGVPGASASVDSGLLTQLRTRWNCGMTIPVEWGLHFENGGYILTQMPLIKDGRINKTTVASVENFSVKAGENALKNIEAAAMEIDAEIENPSEAPVRFRVRVGENEYTEIGWNKNDGYYVDRTHTSDGHISLPNYAAKYVSETSDSRRLLFYILCDDGSLEVFCGNGKSPFYVVTFSSPESCGLSFDSEADVTFTKLNINKIPSVWNDAEIQPRVSVGQDNIKLDLGLIKQKEVLVHGTGEVVYEITEGDGVISFCETVGGIKIFAEDEGKAVIKAVCGNSAEYISVTVYGGETDSDCLFNTITAGDWYRSSEGYIGNIKTGDAFIFSERQGEDFMYSAQFDLNSGIAAALVFRANSDMSQYIIANYDHGAGLVKLWSSAGDNVQTARRLNDVSNVVLNVVAEGKAVKVYLNGDLAIDYTLRDGAPESGVFGLNVCAAEVVFKAVSVTDDVNGDYVSGDIVWNHTDASAFSIVNRTLNNRLIDGGFYSVEGRKVTLYQNYVASLPEAGTYILEVRGQKSFYNLVLKVSAVPSAVWKDVTLQQNSNAVFFIGNAAGDTVKVNGAAIDSSLFKIDGMQLTIYAAAFAVGENEVAFSDVLRAKVTVQAVGTLEPYFNVGNSGVIYTVLFVLVGLVLAAEGAFIAFTLIKKDKKDGGND